MNKEVILLPFNKQLTITTKEYDEKLKHILLTFKEGKRITVIECNTESVESIVTTLNSLKNSLTN